MKIFKFKSRGEAFISFIVAAIVFFALAFGIIEIATFAYKDVVINQHLEAIVKKAESKSALFIDKKPSDLIEYKNSSLRCNEKGEIVCSKYEKDDEGNEIFVGLSEDEEAKCLFWQALLAVSKSDEINDIYGDETLDVIYDNSDKDNKNKNTKCKSKVAVIVPGLRAVRYDDVIIFEKDNEGTKSESSGENSSSEIPEEEEELNEKSVRDRLLSNGVINANVELVKQKGLFSFYSDNKEFTRKMYHVGKPRVFGKSGTQECVNGSECPSGEICFEGKCRPPQDCSPGKFKCGKQCCDEGQTCNSKNECVDAEPTFTLTITPTPCPLDKECGNECCGDGEL